MNYGTVTLRLGYWEIACDPQVRTLIKRVFPRAPQHAADCVRLTDNEQNGRDLLWFLQRYPMQVAAMDHLVAQSERHVDREVSVAQLLANRRPPDTFALAKPARDYQAFAGTMVQIRNALLLADELGLGKTISAMCPMPANLPAVVVYPAYLPGHWEDKLAEFAPQLRVHTIRSGKPYDLVKKPGSRVRDLWDTLPDVILCTYHRLRGWSETLAGIAQYLVFEECQQLRNDDSDLYRAAEYIAGKVPMKMGLSATPIYNYGGEFFNVLNVLMPGVLGSRDEFLREWCISVGTGKHGLKDPEAFGQFLRREGIMLRRTRKEVQRELPPLSIIPHRIGSDALKLGAGGGDAIALARTIVSHNATRQQRFTASGEFDRMLRQATGIAKAPYVADFVRMLVEGGRKVILFGWHREVYNIWLDRLADLKPVMYTGSESPQQKRQSKEAFISGDAQILIMSLRSGAGADGLQYACNTAVIGELDWSSGVMRQCLGRVDRDGQDESTFGYILLSDAGADPVMAQVAGVKYEQLEGVVNPDAALVERVDIGHNALRELARQFLDANGDTQQALEDALEVA